MDALSATSRPSTHLDSTCPTPCSSLKPTPHRRSLFLPLGDFHGVGQLTSSHRGRVRAVSHGGAQSGSGEAAFGNGYGLLSGRGDVQSDTNIGEKDIRIADGGLFVNFSSTSGITSSCGSRAGLFRTPISGGVQSATSAHGLPHPAQAVRNLMEQIPGWSGLSNARVTIFGDVYPLPEGQQEHAHMQYVAKHQQCASQQWGNFYCFRMQNISDIYFIGGFGTVAWVDVKQYESLRPDKISVDGGEQYLKELNAIFSKPLRDLLSTETEVDDAALISIDSKGTDIRVRQGAQFNIQRLPFDVANAVETLEEAKAALDKLINKSSKLNLQKKA